MRWIVVRDRQDLGLGLRGPLQHIEERAVPPSPFQLVLFFRVLRLGNEQLGALREARHV